MADKLDRTELAPARSALIYEGWIARTHDKGHPLTYSHGDEYRDDAELLNILDQAKRLSIPVTLLHPPGLIAHDAKPDNYVGKVFDAYLDGDHVVARFLVETDEGQAAIEDGVIELSLGYTANRDAEGYQRDIGLNHLSIVPAGRCGTCELNPNRVDCEAEYRRETGGQARLVGTELASGHSDATTAGMQVALKVVLDAESEQALARVETAFDRLAKMSAAPAIVAPTEEHEHKVDCACTNRASALHSEAPAMDELKAQLDAALAKVTSLEAALSASTTKAQLDASLAAEKAEASLTVATSQIAKLTEDLKVKSDEVVAAQAARADADEAVFNARVDARVELLKKADKVGIEDASSKKDVEIKLAVIKTVRGKDVKSDAAPAYIDGMFDIAMEQFEASVASNATVREAVEEHKDEAENTANRNPLKAEAEIAAAAEAARKDRWRR